MDIKLKEIASQPVETAESLPFYAYTDEALYQNEKEKIFHNDWVFLCSEYEIPETGDYFAISLADEPIMVIRGQGGELRALSNICRHRGTMLLDEGIGQIEKYIVCPYHAWTYADDGKLRAVPFQGEAKVDKEKHCLPQFKVETWNKLIFVNLNPDAGSLAERFASIDDYLAAYDIPRFTAGTAMGSESWQANWKLAMENAMESYHLFKVHQETLEQSTPTKQAYYIAGSPEWTLTGGKIKKEKSIFSWGDSDKEGEIDVYHQYVLVSLPPSFVGILTYESFDWISVFPTSHQSTFIRSGGMTSGKSYKVDKYTREFVDKFYEEDKWICERVQKSMISQKSHGGKLIDMERVITDFHQYFANRVFNAESGMFHQAAEADAFLNFSKD